MVDPTVFDPNTFSAFEHTGWQRVAHHYNTSFADLTMQAVEPLLRTADVQASMNVLDVATGRGDVAAAAAQKGARVVGVDFSSSMLAEARRRYPSIEFREGNAEALLFDDNSFDALIINFGILHFGKPEQALHEALRVLRSGAKLSFTVWAPPEQALGFGIILQAIADYGNWEVSLPIGPHTFHFSDAQECSRTLLEIGFADTQITHLPLVWDLPSPDFLFSAMHEGTVRTGSLLQAQGQESLTAIRRATELAGREYEKNGKLALPMAAILVSASKL